MYICMYMCISPTRSASGGSADLKRLRIQKKTDMILLYSGLVALFEGVKDTPSIHLRRYHTIVACFWVTKKGAGLLLSDDERGCGIIGFG